MNGVHDPELAAHVVAWHNRHPLAVRITIGQVLGLGTVKVPLIGLQLPVPPAALLEQIPATPPRGVGGLRARATEGTDSSSQTDAPPTRASPEPQLFRRSRHSSRREEVQPAFSELFIERLNLLAIARFAGRYGAEHDPFEGKAPVRDVAPDPDAIALHGSVQIRYLKTVAIEANGERVRLLLAASRWRRPAIIGARVYSRTRIAWSGCALSFTALAVAASVLLPASQAGFPAVASALPAALTLPSGPPEPGEAVVPPMIAMEASSAPGGSARPVVAALVPASSPAAIAATVEPSLAIGLNPRLPENIRESRAEVKSASASSSDPRSSSSAWPVDIRPKLTPEAARDARRLAAALRQTIPAPHEEPSMQAASASPQAALAVADSGTLIEPTGRQAPVSLKLEPSRAVAVALTTAPTSGTGRSEPLPPHQAPRLIQAPAAGVQGFALVARQTRSRAASELLLGLMRDSEIPAGWPATRTEVIPTAQGFRAGWFPFASREDAETARDRLSRSGLPTEVIEF